LRERNWENRRDRGTERIESERKRERTRETGGTESERERERTRDRLSVREVEREC
jgi:hypothetical protein